VNIVLFQTDEAQLVDISDAFYHVRLTFINFFAISVND